MTTTTWRAFGKPKRHAVAFGVAPWHRMSRADGREGGGEHRTQFLAAVVGENQARSGQAVDRPHS